MYSPAFPLIFQQYAELLTSEDRHGKGASAAEQRVGPRENEAREINTKIASDVRPQRQNTLLESAHDVGGISVFIYLFAKVVFYAQLFRTKRKKWFLGKGFCFLRTLHYMRLLFTTTFPSFVKPRARNHQRENTGSRLFTEVKPCWTGLISGWVTI